MRPETECLPESEATSLARQGNVGQRKVAATLGHAIGTWKSQWRGTRLRIREMLRKYFGGKTRNDQPDSDDRKITASNDPARKSDNSIPRWCRPIDKKAPGSAK
jgi:hypothetical protein